MGVEAAKEVSGAAVRTVSRIVADSWPETIAVALRCGGAASNPSTDSAATCILTIGTVQRCASRTETEDVEEEVCD